MARPEQGVSVDRPEQGVSADRPEQGVPVDRPEEGGVGEAVPAFNGSIRPPLQPLLLLPGVAEAPPPALTTPPASSGIAAVRGVSRGMRRGRAWPPLPLLLQVCGVRAHMVRCTTVGLASPSSSGSPCRSGQARVFHNTALYRRPVYSTASNCTVAYRSTLYHVIPFHTAPVYCSILNNTVPFTHRAMLYRSVP